jgi:hypothetical protein
MTANKMAPTTTTPTPKGDDGGINTDDCLSQY